MRTFVAKTTVNFPDFELYVRIGDMLVFDPSNANNLTVYRGGSIVKTIKATPISIAAMLKVKMLEEIVHKPVPPTPKPVPVAPKKPAEAPKHIVVKNKHDQKRVEKALADSNISGVEAENPVTGRQDVTVKVQGVACEMKVGIGKVISEDSTKSID